MDPFITAIVLMAIIVSGVLGSFVIVGLFKRDHAKIQSRSDEPRLEALLEGQRLLEARVEQLEEELSFHRALNTPADTGQLPGGDRSDP